MEDLEPLDKEPLERSIDSKDRKDLPDIDSTLTLSIIALFTSVIFIGIVLAGIVLKRTRDYHEFTVMSPDRYSLSSIQKSDTARVIGLFALVIPIPFYLLVALFNIFDILEFIFGPLQF